MPSPAPCEPVGPPSHASSPPPLPAALQALQSLVLAEAAEALGPPHLPGPLSPSPPPSSAAAPEPLASPPRAPADLPRHWARDFFTAALSLAAQHNQVGLWLEGAVWGTSTRPGADARVASCSWWGRMLVPRRPLTPLQEALSRLQGLAQLFRGSLAVAAGVAQVRWKGRRGCEGLAEPEGRLSLRSPQAAGAPRARVARWA
jgi:hypothetical protein